MRGNLRLIHVYEELIGRSWAGLCRVVFWRVEGCAKSDKQARSGDSCMMHGTSLMHRVQYGCDDPNNTEARTAKGISSLPQITTTCLPAHQLDMRYAKLLIVRST